jgi:hypothetical protein
LKLWIRASGNWDVRSGRKRQSNYKDKGNFEHGAGSFRGLQTQAGDIQGELDSAHVQGIVIFHTSSDFIVQIQQNIKERLYFERNSQIFLTKDVTVDFRFQY